MKSNSGRDYLVLWTYDEALDVEGEAMTGSVGTHALSCVVGTLP